MRTLSLLAALTACKAVPPQSPTPPTPVEVQVARVLATAATVATLAQLQAVAAGDGLGCAVYATVAEASSVAAETLVAESLTFPDVSLDLTTCLAFMEDPPVLATVSPAVQVAVDVTLREARVRVATYTTQSCGVLAALSYVESAAAPILDELSHPDGMVDIPAMVVDCGELTEED